MKEKIVYITMHQLSQRWLNAYCLDELNKEFDIEYWECPNIIQPLFQTSNTIDRPWVRKIGDVADFKAAIKALPADTLIVLNFMLPLNTNVLKIISRRFKTMIVVNFWSTDSRRVLLNIAPKEDIGCAIESSREETNISLLSIKRSIYKNYYIRLFCKSIGVFVKNLHDQPLAKTKTFWTEEIDREKKRRGYQYIEQNCNIIYISTVVGEQYYINHADYEKYLTLLDAPRFIKHPYIVYADSGFPVIGDYNRYIPETKKPMVIEDFNISMRHFFDMIEQQYGIPVIIASHPGANRKDGDLGNRESYVFKTAELIKDCEFVITPGTCALSYAAFWNKPFVLISNQTIMQDLDAKTIATNFSKAFRKELCNTDICNDIKPYVKAWEEDVRKLYMSKSFDMSKKENNVQLFTRHFHTIYNKLKNDSQQTR